MSSSFDDASNDNSDFSEDYILELENYGLYCKVVQIHRNYTARTEPRPLQALLNSGQYLSKCHSPILRLYRNALYIKDK